MGENTHEIYCKACGGTNVEVMAWVDANSREVTNSEPPFELAWCRDCQRDTETGKRALRAAS